MSLLTVKGQNLGRVRHLRHMRHMRHLRGTFYDETVSQHTYDHNIRSTRRDISQSQAFPQ